MTRITWLNKWVELWSPTQWVELCHNVTAPLRILYAVSSDVMMVQAITMEVTITLLSLNLKYNFSVENLYVITL